MIKDDAGRCISYLFWAGFGPCQLSYRERSQTAGHLGHLLPPLILPLPESLDFRKSFHSWAHGMKNRALSWWSQT